VGSFPEVALSNGEEVWKGLSTKGSWIGGGANQTAMLVFGASKMFAQMIAVDVLVANLWMGFAVRRSKNQIKLTNG
jgi:uncharacterized membrane protein